MPADGEGEPAPGPPAEGGAALSRSTAATPGCDGTWFRTSNWGYDFLQTTTDVGKFDEGFVQIQHAHAHAIPHTLVIIRKIVVAETVKRFCCIFG